MTSRPAFVIVESFPTYCPSTDAMIGQRRRIVQDGIMTEAWAIARAGILEDFDRRHCGDSAFHARPASDPFGRNALSERAAAEAARRAAQAAEEMPF